MKYKICAAIPIKSDKLEDNRNLIAEVIEKNPDLIELRFDYIDNFEKITPVLAENLIKLIQPYLPVIVTLRDHSEGGQIRLDFQNRLKILETLISGKPDYIDIEMNSIMPILKRVINFSSKNGVQLIFSYHNFKETESYSEILNIIDNFLKKTKENPDINFDIVKKSVYKLIFAAQKFEDNIVPLKLCKFFSQKGHKVISFCMGVPRSTNVALYPPTFTIRSEYFSGCFCASRRVSVETTVGCSCIPPDPKYACKRCWNLLIFSSPSRF